MFDLFYRTLAALLGAGVSVIAEASFRRELDEPRLRPLAERARVAHVRCAVPVDLARERFLAREPTRRRRSGAGDAADQIERGAFDWRPFEPLELNVPRLDVDTTDGYRPTLAEIVAFCQMAARPLAAR